MCRAPGQAADGSARSIRASGPGPAAQIDPDEKARADSVMSDAVTAVDVQELARDEVGPVGGEEGDRFGDVDRVPEPAQRNVAARDGQCRLVELPGADQAGG